MSAATLAYRWPQASRFALDHLLADTAPPPPKQAGRHGTRKKRRRRLPKWLRLAGSGAHRAGHAVQDFWRDSGADNSDLLDKWEAQFKPITGPTAVSLPYFTVPFARVAGSPPWAAAEGAKR